MLLSDNLQGVQHLGIMVPDIEQAKTWYSQKLNFTVDYTPHIQTDEGDIELAFLNLNGMVVELVQLVGAELEEVKTRGDGHIDHFAIDVLDIEDAIQEQLAKNLALHPSTSNGAETFPLFSDGVKYVFFNGPFNEKVEFNQALHLDLSRRENNIGGWGHLGIPVTDMDSSRQFYSQFGFEEIAYAEVPVGDDQVKVSLMENAGFVLEFFQLVGDDLAEVRTRKDGFIDHIAFDVLDADKAYADIKDAGLDLLQDAPITLPLFGNGVKYFMIRGPMGEKVEFNEMIK
ncbi:MAG: VOC family protein [Anaerolineales bacterium]|nr:VOC family protein [Anaerolineales bacterium]